MDTCYNSLCRCTHENVLVLSPAQFFPPLQTPSKVIKNLPCFLPALSWLPLTVSATVCAFLQLRVLNYTHLLLAGGDRKMCFLSWQLLKPDVVLAGCDWLADEREWLFLDRHKERCKQTHFSTESAGPS